MMHLTQVVKVELKLSKVCHRAKAFLQANLQLIICSQSS
jgi:hypothetical protein